MRMFRQGDVLIMSTDSIPATVQPIERDKGRIVLAYGEVTGHAHAIHDVEAEFVGIMGATDWSERFLNVTGEAGVDLKHEEHDTIHLPFGQYRVVQQREYDLASGQVRNVAD